ncbi:hypothetical protein PHSY_003782 [Pseudozyma hubeiensis SY62]|uniref:Uncharacterized protein n=1 Tax=Pseudozyma hubeiensis (strain SY62) TaxID=1305764 RepID=R9P4M6_PSEHS|nr:hypothetical protein PHSY_003782 [Pseudozyma hubeiensis SY62]GAC96202.1 hypothetical protein PHSY_003782 [Pseudozyma hubeiensis SY62]
MLRTSTTQAGRALLRSRPELVSPSSRPFRIRHLSTTPFMARKSARAIAAADSTASPETQDASTSKVSLSDLNPKSCLTCGRVITPRAKWAKDWNGIKYCSDRCRSSRPGKIVAAFKIEQKNREALTDRSGVTCSDNDVRVDVETFVEGVLLEIAAKAGGGTLEDAQDRIRSLLESASIPVGMRESETKPSDTDEDEDGQSHNASTEIDDSTHVHLLWKALDSPPGLRERIRRAARRLALGLTHESNTRQTSITTTEAGSLELLQGGKVLRTVQDLSFAKGVLHVKLKNS